MAGWYPALTSPPGVPPNWVFPVVWTALYTLTGLAGWRVWRRVGAGRALRLWGWQLAIGALWTPAFFGLRNPALGLVVILAFLAAVAATIRAFARIEAQAAWLMAPLLAWVGYATWLNAGFWWLNAG